MHFARNTLPHYSAGGDRREVFSEDQDRLAYLRLVQENLPYAGLRILGYCLWGYSDSTNRASYTLYFKPIGTNTSLDLPPVDNKAVDIVTLFSKVAHPVEVTIVNETAFLSAAIQFALASSIVVAGCGDAPLDFVTCVPSVVAGGVLFTGGGR